MSVIARPRSGGGAALGGFGSRRSVDRGREAAAAPAMSGSGSGSAPRPAVESHHEVVVWVGRAAGPMGSEAGPSAAPSAPATVSWPPVTSRFGALPGGHGLAARRARAWY